MLIFIAFLAGFLSFLSPCVLPLIPFYISYTTGIALRDFLKEEDQGTIRRITILNSLLFILGFSTVFILLGASVSFLGQYLLEYREIIKRIGGVLIIIFGLYIMGVIKLGFPEKKLERREKGFDYIGSFFIGMVFAIGWTPCVGPILASILVYASTLETIKSGIILLSAYSLGLGIPFFITSLAVNSILIHFEKIKKYVKAISFASGIFLVIMGLLLLTNYFQVLTRLLPPSSLP
jgi:cytochrome c-type biogenesis protein